MRDQLTEEFETDKLPHLDFDALRLNGRGARAEELLTWVLLWNDKLMVFMASTVSLDVARLRRGKRSVVELGSKVK
jgi:hypothetical protein